MPARGRKNIPIPAPIKPNRKRPITNLTTNLIGGMIVNPLGQKQYPRHGPKTKTKTTAIKPSRPTIRRK